MSYSVVVLSMFRDEMYEDDGLRTVDGFATLELAREYARRRTRDAVEVLRAPGQTATELRSLWLEFGEDCYVLDDIGPKPSTELAFFTASPATRQERDWVALDPVIGPTRTRRIV